MSFVDFRYMAEAFDSLIQLNENSKRRVADDSAANQVSHVMVREELLPDVRLQLLDSERQPMVVTVDVQNHSFDALALLQNFRRVLDAARRDVRHMNEPVDSLFNFNERAEIREISNAAGDNRTYRVTFGQRRPWIRLGLLESERNPPVFHIDIENDGFHFLIDVKKLRRMFDALAP